jgi:hypothetical protein
MLPVLYFSSSTWTYRSGRGDPGVTALAQLNRWEPFERAIHRGHHTLAEERALVVTGRDSVPVAISFVAVSTSISVATPISVAAPVSVAASVSIAASVSVPAHRAQGGCGTHPPIRASRNLIPVGRETELKRFEHVSMGVWQESSEVGN